MYLKLSSKWILYLNVKPEIIKVLEQNNFFCLGLCKVFLDVKTKALPTKET